jgi:hypothetical protein
VQQLSETRPVQRALDQIAHGLLPPPVDIDQFFEHSEHLEPGPFDLTTDVTLASLVIGEQDVARSESVLVAATDFDLGAATHMHDKLTTRCYVEVPNLGACLAGVSKEDRLNGYLRRHRPSVGHDQRHLQLFEMALTIVAGINTCDQQGSVTDRLGSLAIGASGRMQRILGTKCLGPRGELLDDAVRVLEVHRPHKDSGMQLGSNRGLAIVVV